MPGFAGFIRVGEYSFAMRDKEGRTITFKVDGDCLNILINNFIVRITTGLI
jgi:hypothetical protein